MKKKMFVTGCPVALIFALLIVPAWGQLEDLATVEDCMDRIDLIQADLDAIADTGGIGGRNAERTYDSLTSKLQGAIAKLDQGKKEDAVKKLEDFRAAVITMRDAAKPKLSAEDAELLLAGNGDSDIDEGVDGAILCVWLLP